jgi:EAL domain-containing protein (putative c-di-GMP-specific phosphodiesterase class I)
MTFSSAAGCEGCRKTQDLGFDFTMAFQPIVDLETRTVFAHEALVRGLAGEGAGSVLARVNADNRYSFDQACRIKAIEQASALGMRTLLSINFLPNAVYRAEACIRVTLATAERCGFPIERIMFELVEDERANDLPHLTSIFRDYKQRGFLTAVDDFGAGYAGFDLLAEFQPDVVKIDMHLIRDLHIHRVRRTIVAGFVGICRELGIRVIAEGVEHPAEVRVLRDLGVSLFQGYLFAKPAVGPLPAVDWDAAGLTR